MTERVLQGSEPSGVPETRRRSTLRPRRAKSKLSSSFRTPLWHRVAERMIAVFALTAVLAIALIFVFIAREAIPMLWEAEFAEEVQLRDLFFAKEWRGYDEPVFIWQPVGEPAKYNVVPLFVGSLKVTLLAMLMSVPLGVGCAMFVALYAPRAVREVVKPVIELLAGIPSVVLGFFALMVIASWAQATFGFHFRLNAVVAAIGLALTIVPVIFTISEDAIQSVPHTLTEAALALGARKYQVALRVILPAAIPGIAAGVVLGFGRAIGETMIVLMASGNAAIMELFDFSTSVRTVTATIAAELGEVAQGDPHWRVLFLLGVMLFAVTFVLNVLGDLFIQRLQKKLTAS
ncbi:MAG: phosphate ABC transporter permease subunit PstC [Polyangiales bacterium]